MGGDLPEHWQTDIEINESWNTQDEFERILKFHFVTALTKYIHSNLLLCAPDIDVWRIKDLIQCIFLSSDPENEDLKELVYDYLHIPWIKGEFLSEFAPEWVGSYLIVLQKASGDIRDITPVDIWRRTTGNSIVQATQQNDRQNMHRYLHKLQSVDFVNIYFFERFWFPVC